jgi:putative DNA primase/helicase
MMDTTSSVLTLGLEAVAIGNPCSRGSRPDDGAQVYLISALKPLPPEEPIQPPPVNKPEQAAALEQEQATALAKLEATLPQEPPKSGPADAVEEPDQAPGEDFGDSRQEPPGKRKSKSVPIPSEPTSGEQQTPEVLSETDLMNGRRFAADHKENVRFVADWNRWACFDGSRWVVDGSETIIESLAKETVKKMAWEAATLVANTAKEIAKSSGDDEEADRLKSQLRKAQAALAHAKKSADMRAIRRMLQAARSELGICVANGGQVFDTHRDLLNCPNGTVQLRTGKLRPHRREDYLTRMAPTNFNPQALRARYHKFLDSVFDAHPMVSEYIRAFSGSVCTGEVKDQSFHVLHGEGSNGKNVLVDIWKVVLGENEYVHTAASELLVSNDRAARHPTEKVGSRGARLVVCSETGEDGTLDETKMKSLTGDAEVVARGMRQDYYSFPATGKFVLMTNNKPRVRGTDHRVWRRIRLVPFAVKFWKESDKTSDPNGKFDERFRANPDLPDILKNEAEGILADMVEHAQKFYASGCLLKPPQEVVAATDDYRRDEDNIGQFFAACAKSDAASQMVAGDFYRAFVTWWEEQGHSSANGWTSGGSVGREARGDSR